MTTIYHNLDELLQGDTPHHWGRMLYKYTDCGPWTVYIVNDSPERVEHCGVEIRETPNGLVAKAEGWLTPDFKQGPVEDALRFLGFEDDGTNKLRWRSIRAYAKRLDRFFRSEHKTEWQLDRNDICVGCLRITLSRKVPATVRQIYYEDAEAFDHDKCCGIKIGSIVEGSDVEIDPITLNFPFTDGDLDAAVKSIDSGAALVWEWANVPKDITGRRNPNGKTDAERGADCPLL